MFSYKIAKNDWVLQLDADEYLSKGLQYSLKKLISLDYSLVNVRWVNINSKNQIYYRYKGILFRKSECYYLGVITEYVKPFDKKRIITVDQDLFHRPSDEDWIVKVYSKKWKKWSKIHTDFLIGDFKKVLKWNYPYSDWDYPKNIRRKYPILFGCLLSIPVHLLIGLRSINKPGFNYYYEYCFQSGLYLSVVYWNFAKRKYFSHQ